MSGPLRVPGLLTVEHNDGTIRHYRVTSGPWKYASSLCWVEEGKLDTTYAPIENVVTWSKEGTTQ